MPDEYDSGYGLFPGPVMEYLNSSLGRSNSLAFPIISSSSLILPNLPKLLLSSASAEYGSLQFGEERAG